MDSPCPVPQVPGIKSCQGQSGCPSSGFRLQSAGPDRRWKQNWRNWNDETIWNGHDQWKKKRKLLEIIAGNVFLKDLAPHLPGALIGYNLAAFWWHLVEISYVFWCNWRTAEFGLTPLSLRSCTWLLAQRHSQKRTPRIPMFPVCSAISQTRTESRRAENGIQTGNRNRSVKAWMFLEKMRLYAMGDEHLDRWNFSRDLPSCVNCFMYVWLSHLHAILCVAVCLLMLVFLCA